MEFRVLLLIALIQIACSNAMRREKGGAAGKGADIRQAEEVSELENPSKGEAQEDLTLKRMADSSDLDTIIQKRIAEAIGGVTTRVSALEKSRAKVSTVTSVSQRVSSLETNKHFCQSNKKDVTAGNKGKGVSGETNVVITFASAFKNKPSIAYAIVKALNKKDWSSHVTFDADMRAFSQTSFTIGLQTQTADQTGQFMIQWMACGI